MTKVFESMNLSCTTVVLPSHERQAKDHVLPSQEFTSQVAEKEEYVLSREAFVKVSLELAESWFLLCA